MSFQQKIRGGAPVIYVTPRGTARLGRFPGQELAEAEARLRDQLANATPPESCGPEIPVAPARGPMLSFTPRRMEQTDTGGFVRRHDGYLGRDAARVADAFDLMTDQARRAHAKAVRAAEAAGQAAPAFVPPFTTGQVNVARDYAALAERCASSGMKCSSLEALAQSGGGTGGGDREAAIFRDLQQLRTYHRRIGDGLAREVRRIRPNGRKRRAIWTRALVDQVCLGGMTLSAVLEAHEWEVRGQAVEGLKMALGAALDRMQGHNLAGGRRKTLDA